MIENSKEETISVVMSVYNEKKEWLEEAIESILNQTYTNIELIIILDNPYNKELEEVIIKFSDTDNRIKFYRNNENIGLVKSLNKAILLSSGSIIARMDADDICSLDRIEKQYKFLQNNSEIDLVGGNINYVNEDSRVIDEKICILEDSDSINNRLRWYNCFNHPTWMIRKRVFLSLNGYRNIDAAEDYDFVCRLVLNGFKCANIKDRVLNYRVRTTSISNSNKLIQRITTYEIAKSFRKGIEVDIDLLRQKYLRIKECDKQKFSEYIKLNKKEYCYKFKLIYLFLSNKYIRRDIFHRLRSRLASKGV